MPEIGEKHITIKELNSMQVLKRDIVTKKPKIWLGNDGIVYKKEPTRVVSRLKDYFEYYSEFDELSECEFPKKILYVDGNEFGYTDEYLKDYRTMGKRIEKSKLSLEFKKEILYKIIKLSQSMHSIGFVHNDLHPYNLLYDCLNIKIIDFVQLKIKEVEGNSRYYRYLKVEIYYLNLLILSILFDKDIKSIMKSEYEEFILELNISNEYKEYLFRCIKYDDSIVYEDPSKYVKSMTKNNIETGKKLINSLQL